MRTAGGVSIAIFTVDSVHISFFIFFFGGGGRDSVKISVVFSFSVPCVAVSLSFSCPIVLYFSPLTKNTIPYCVYNIVPSCPLSACDINGPVINTKKHSVVSFRAGIFRKPLPFSSGFGLLYFVPILVSPSSV